MKVRKTTILLFLIVMVAAITGCSKRTNELPDFPETPNDGTDSWLHNDEDFDFTWFVNTSWFSWNTNGSDLVSKVIYEKTGAKIKFLTPVTDDNQMLSTMIAGNKLPDVISIQSWYPQVSQLADQGYVYSFDKLVDKWAPSFRNKIQDDVWNWFSQSDGDTYGVPNFAYSNKYIEQDEKFEPNGAIMVRKDWYEEVETAGIDMTNPDGFIEGCKYISNKYGNNVIPVMLDNFDSEGNPSVNWLSQYFAVPFEKEDGSYQYKITHPLYLEMLKFLNKLNNNGLIKQSNYSSNSEQIRTDLASGKVFVSMVTPQDYLQAFYSNYNSDIEYIPLVLRNSNGDDPVLQDIRGMGFLLTMITKNAERPDLIIKVIEYLYSEEGQRLVAFGVEGDTWEWSDDTHSKIAWTDKYLEDFNNNDTSKYGLFQMTLVMNLAYINKLKPDEGKSESDIYIENLKKPLSPYSYDYNASFLKHDTSSKDYFDYINKETRVESAFAEWLPKIIRAKSEEEVNSLYQKALNEMNRKGLDDVISFSEKSYQSAKDSLDIKTAWPPYLEGYTSPNTGPNGDFSYWSGTK